jgi:predicted nucleic acid-binding protein
MTADDSVTQVEAWLDARAAVVAHPATRDASLLAALLREAGTAGNLSTDAHPAALAMEHRAEIVSYDRDFARFPGVRHRLPG